MTEGQKTSTQNKAFREPIAVIGIGCRFPGADGPDEFWRLMIDGVDATGEIPADRFDVDAFYDPRRGIPGKMYTRRGGFLSLQHGLDSLFFGLSPREAARLDPQQRLLLEVTWEALEDAGLPGADLEGSLTGIFIGMWSNEYEDLLGLDLGSLDLYGITGGSRFSASGRLSHFLGVEGPSMITDTACSSALTALHLACQSLREGECTVAIAGGSNLILHPQATIGMCQANVMAGDGRCKFGSVHADGYARGEGVGMVVLKPYAQAEQDGDPIYAVIRGSALNNNGRSSGLLVTPGDRTQTTVFEQACEAAGISPADLGYVEAHGTGTPVGDPIEIKALSVALSAAGRGPDDPVCLGSVKTNIAHGEGAAGIAGLIKVALCLKHGQIPPSLHSEELNPAIPWQELPVEICRDLRPFPEGERRLAGLNSFGLSGSNAHVVLEGVATEANGPASEGPEILTLSARGNIALKARAEQMRDWLRSESGTDLGEICATAALRRSHLENRLAVVGENAQEIADKLDAFLVDESRLGLVSGRAAEEGDPKLVFVFPGHGSQWLGMGRRLVREEPIFQQAMERCDAAIREQVGWSVLQELEADETASRIDEVGIVQPILFAIEVALAELWRSWGFEPDAVVGHSMGEVAAAHVAGILDLQDAARVICQRSQLLQTVAGLGSAVLVELPLEAARQEIVGLEDKVSIAASNSATSTVMAGDPETIQEILERLEARDIFCRLIKMPFAAHSPQMDPLKPELLRLLDDLRPQPAKCRFYSTVLDAFVAGPELDAEYWGRNLRDPVLFANALEQLISEDHLHFIEIGPHPILLAAIQEQIERAGDSLGEGGAKALAVASLRREEDERAMLLAAVGEFHVAGRKIDWRRFHVGRKGHARLPRYPWQRQDFEIEPADAHRWGRAGAAPSGGHPLLGPAHFSASEPGRVAFDVHLDHQAAKFFADHQIQGEILLPAAGMADLALGAAEQVFGTRVRGLEAVRFERALVLAHEPDQQEIAQIVLEPSESDSDQVAFSFYAAARSGQDEPLTSDWRLHCAGIIRLGEAEVASTELGSRPADLIAGEAITGERFYGRLAARGYGYERAFQGIERAWPREEETLAQLRSASELGLALGGFALHPALLDAAFQACLAGAEDGPTYVPVGLGELRVLRQIDPASHLWSRVRPLASTEVGQAADIEIFDDEGHLVAAVHELRFQALDDGSADHQDTSSWLHAIEWETVELTSETSSGPATRRWLLVGGNESLDESLAERLARELESRGAEVHKTAIDQLPQRLREEGVWQGVVQLVGRVEIEHGGTSKDPASKDLERAWDQGCCALLDTVQALSALPESHPRLYVVTRGAQPVLDGEAPDPAQAGVVGLGRVVANEHPELRAVRIDLENDDSSDADANLVALVDELLSDSSGDEIAFRGGERYEPRLRRYEPGTGENAERRARRIEPGTEQFQLELDTAGVFDDLEWRPAPHRVPGPGEVEIEVVAVGLNFRDVLVALGSIPDPSGKIHLGVECAGRIVSVGPRVDEFKVGDEVVAIGLRTLSSRIVTAEALVAPKPPNLTLEEAATLPVVFATVYLSLIDRAGLKKGEKVLIHSAAGGVGLAAVGIAQAVGAEIYATAGQPEKRTYLESLGIRHVMDSRSLDWVDQVMELTEGKGVDLILNSLAGEAIPKGIACLAPYGRFLELGKIDFLANNPLGMAPFIRNLAFHGIDAERMYREDHDRFRQLLRSTLKFFADHNLEALPRTTFAANRVADAFRFMAKGQHIGKIVLRVAGEAVDLYPRSELLRPDATYLLTGGLGGVGLALTQWMVEKGARHLVLLGRSGPKPEAQAVLDRLRATGADIRTVRADVTDAKALSDVFAKIADDRPPLRGIVHGAMVLDDGILRQLDHERFHRVMRPKALGAWNLDRASQGLNLDFFVMFSSAAALVGNPGQGNYVAANAFLDALAHHRRARGLTASSMAWGPWAEVGVAARPDRGGRLSDRGLISFAPSDGLEIFGRLAADENAVHVGVMPIDWASWFETHPTALQASLNRPWIDLEANSQTASGGVGDEIRDLPVEERLPHLENLVCNLVGRVMGLAAAQIDVEQPIHRMGLDSLMAVEMRNRVEREFGLTVSIPKLLQGRTVRQLAREILDSFEAETNTTDEIETMSEDQVDALLLEMLAEAEDLA